jgi:hydrogenase nickel incorporation protein HypA/HybF
MHEFSLATQIAESVSQFAAAHQASKVLKVRLAIGELTCIEAEQLRFCFHSITPEPLWESATLDIQVVAAAVSCSHCRYQGPPRYWEGALAAAMIPTLQCPRCGKAATPTRGHECEIKSVQFVHSQPEAVSAESS